METTIAVKVVPRGAADEIVGWLGDDVLRVRMQAPPQDRAKKAFEALLASALGLKRGAVAIAGVSREEIVRRLAGR